jgi:hypothetical protein
MQKGNKSLLDFPNGKFEPFLMSAASCMTAHPDKSIRSSKDPSKSVLYKISCTERSSKYFVRETERIVIFLHPRNTQIYGSLNSIAAVSVEQYSHTSFSYSVSSSNLLPSPYDTDCLDYKSVTSFSSQAHCMAACAANVSLSTLGVWPTHICPAYEPADVPYLKGGNFLAQKWMTESCKRFCSKQDCIAHSFSKSDFTGVASRKPDSSVNETWASITVKSSTDPSILIMTLPGISFVVFVTNGLGCIAFWTGLTPLFLAHRKGTISCLTSVTRIIRKCRQQNVRKFLVTLTTVSCLCAYIYQVFTASEAYFEYKTVNKESLAFATQKRLPLMNFCYQNTSLGLMRLSNTLDYLTTSRGRIDLSEAEETSKRFQIFGLSCYSIKLNKTEGDAGDLLQREMIQMRIRLPANSSNNRPSFFLSFRPILNASHTPYDPEDNFLEVETRNYAAVLFATFTRIHKKRLNAPYDTKCLTYATSSSSACFHGCYAQKFESKFGALPADAPTDSVITIDPESLNDADKLIVRKIRYSCSSQCPDDCFHANHYLKLLTETPHPASKRQWDVRIMGAQEITDIKYSARMEFSDLTTVVLSAASFWLLFCPLTLLTHKKVRHFMGIHKVKAENDRKRALLLCKRRRVTFQGT